MTLEQFPLQLWRRWIGAKERGQHRVGEMRLGDGADLVTADSHDGAVLRKEHGIVIARVHGGNHGKEPLDILPGQDGREPCNYFRGHHAKLYGQHRH